MKSYKIGSQVEFLAKLLGDIKRGQGKIIAIRDTFFSGRKYIVEARLEFQYGLLKREETKCFEVKEKDIIGEI